MEGLAQLHLLCLCLHICWSRILANTLAYNRPAMDQLRANIDVYQIDEEKTPFYENMDKYYTLKSGCLYDYWVEYDVSARLEECSRFITRWKPEELVQRQRNRDPEAILEIAVRYEDTHSAHELTFSVMISLISVCELKCRSLEAALNILDAYTDPTCSPERSLRREHRLKRAQSPSTLPRRQNQLREEMYRGF